MRYSDFTGLPSLFHLYHVQVWSIMLEPTKMDLPTRTSFRTRWVTNTVVSVFDNAVEWRFVVTLSSQMLIHELPLVAVPYLAFIL